MGTTTAALLGIPLAYLIGTLPSAQLVARRRGRDPLAEGSGNPGATNVARLAGWRAGVVVLAVDLVKGAAPAAAGLLLVDRFTGLLFGAAAVLGHVFPCWRRFRGGKGVATASGALIVLYPVVSAGAAVVFFAVARLSRAASLASVVIAVGFPIAAALVGAPWPQVVVLAALAVLVVVRHIPNLRRLARGAELGFGPGSVRGGDDEQGGPGS